MAISFHMPLAIWFSPISVPPFSPRMFIFYFFLYFLSLLSSDLLSPLPPSPLLISTLLSVLALPFLPPVSLLPCSPPFPKSSMTYGRAYRRPFSSLVFSLHSLSSPLISTSPYPSSLFISLSPHSLIIPYNSAKFGENGELGGSPTLPLLLSFLLFSLLLPLFLPRLPLSLPKTQERLAQGRIRS